ncbi:MAG TPA: cation/H(+) antiporter, partial [Sphingobacterium sp.]|nr:cation/H(+) antiporter [Sphingobacterium sp.]
MYWVIHLGTQLEAPELLRGQKTSQGAWNDFTSTLFHRLQHPLAILLAQIVTIIIAARIMGWISIKIKQLVVIGELPAGSILG